MVLEEGLLRARFPEYADYARRTKRVVPFVI
jgi:protein-S-isoprenylcysteine O-methyltransferase Ste14